LHAAKDTVASNATAGRRSPSPLDVGRSASFAAFAEQVAYELNGTWNRATFDYLVNNAGFGQMAMFEDTSEELSTSSTACGVSSLVTRSSHAGRHRTVTVSRIQGWITHPS
jgi:NAD(P)-dependent dehydrogenase (short-subunit alcohol dehydrogenase family)